MLPFGLNPVYDIKMILKEYAPPVVFDVGANVGQSALNFINYFPDANVFCFEPLPTTFHLLQKNLSCFDKVHCHNIAFGSERSRKEVRIPPNLKSTRFSLNMQVSEESEHVTEMITMETITDFCHDHDIERIGYLKIDTEGYDMAVLRGGEPLLNSNRIDIIEVEASMNHWNRHHVNITDFLIYLEAKNFPLFGIYEQSQEWILNKPILRRANLLFISLEFAYRFNINNANVNRLDRIDLSS